MEPTEILKKLIEIPSVFPNERKIAIWIEEFLKNCGFNVQRHYIDPKRFNLLAEKGKGESCLLFYGHMDTVPVCLGWKKNPFKLTQKGDKLYGLGAVDMKGGIAAILAAVQNFDENKKIKVLFGVDEENISQGVSWAVQEKKRWFLDIKLIMVAEPGASVSQIGGVKTITLGRKGRIVFLVEVFGVSSHGATPQKGLNAISQAVDFIKKIEKLKTQTHTFLGKSSLFVRKISGEAQGLSVPEKVSLEIDWHLVPPQTIQNAQEELEMVAKAFSSKIKISLKKRKTHYLEPYLIKKNHPLVKKIVQQIKNLYGRVIFNYANSVADDNLLANQLKIPVVTIGPHGGNLHAANEWVSLKSLEEVSQLYKKLIETL